MDAPFDVTIWPDYARTMEKEGVVLFKHLIVPEKMTSLQHEVSHIHSIVLDKVQTMPRPIRNYTDIAERQLGRLDFRCGFVASIFDEVAGPVIHLIKRMSPTVDFRYYWGAIPSLPGSGPTDMHRDIFPVINTTKDQDMCEMDRNLPPYYFTVLIPLIEISKELGPTEFIQGSHRELSVDINKKDIYAPLLSPGDVIIFDGRTLHKGAANQSKETRLVAYMTFIANWYHDQTFAMNDYLFPELSDE